MSIKMCNNIRNTEKGDNCCCLCATFTEVQGPIHKYFSHLKRFAQPSVWCIFSLELDRVQTKKTKENIIQDYVWESDNEMRIEILNQIDKMENDNIN